MFIYFSDFNIITLTKSNSFQYITKTLRDDKHYLNKNENPLKLPVSLQTY
jgi:hypothetical protein